MAKFEDGSYSSLPGIALIAKVLAGKCQMQYTRAAVGKGNIPDEESPKTMTRPAEYVMDAKISSVTTPVNGECQVTVQINSDDVEMGFFATGILLYAEDPDDGEVPYTYLVLENSPEWIRPSTSAVGKLATFDLIAAVGEVDRVTATIDPKSFVTHDEVARLIEGATVKRSVTIPTEGWETGDDADIPGGVHVDIAQEDVTEDMVPFISLSVKDAAKAKTCGMSTTVRTLKGIVRVYAEKAPTEEITATLLLLCAYDGYANGTGGGGGNGYVLPVATSTRLGGVRIGGGVGVEEDGTISVDLAEEVKKVAATDSDTEEMLNDVFSEE